MVAAGRRVSRNQTDIRNGSGGKPKRQAPFTPFVARGTPSAALTYSSYLALDEVLAAQRPKTDEHDELLFIVCLLYTSDAADEL